MRAVMFSDDTDLSESREQVEENLEVDVYSGKDRVSHFKTEYMCVNESNPSGTVRLQETEIMKVEDFKYLGPAVQSNCKCGKEVNKCVQPGWNRRSVRCVIKSFSKNEKKGVHDGGENPDVVWF